MKTGNLNLSLAPPLLAAAARSFEAVWADAGATLNNSGVNGLWSKLYGGANSRLRLRPLRALDCADVESVGADEEGDCVGMAKLNP